MKGRSINTLTGKQLFVLATYLREHKEKVAGMTLAEVFEFLRAKDETLTLNNAGHILSVAEVPCRQKPPRAERWDAVERKLAELEQRLARLEAAL